MINQAGKLEPIMFQASIFRFYEGKSIEMVFRRLPICQVFLDRILECSPLGIASPSDRLTRAALIIVKESFQVYVTLEGISLPKGLLPLDDMEEERSATETMLSATEKKKTEQRDLHREKHDLEDGESDMD
uniref:Uncharacterized protein n=1 Tax=Nelumbo nucifera TaxID=4432 RepID=A0A822Y229_NELNU|nr:TPA_asm: hypothetical protein HUJ06_026790 [Nelumbo nucifera]